MWAKIKYININIDIIIKYNNNNNSNNTVKYKIGLINDLKTRLQDLTADACGNDLNKDMKIKMHVNNIKSFFLSYCKCEKS